MKSNRLIIYALAALLALCPVMSTACSENAKAPETTDQADTTGSEVTTAADTTDTTDTSPSGTETEYTGTTFTFSDDGISMTNELDSGYKIEGTTLTIDEAGTYILTGSCNNGSVKVKKGTTGVKLVLQNLTLASENTAPIVCAKSSEAEIIVLGTNSLSDSEQNNDDNFADNADAENAVMKFKDGSNVTLSGSGTLNITANGKNGIKSGASTDDEGEASLTIKELTLNITASVNDAVNAESTLNVESGNITIDAADDALHSDYTLNIGSETTEPTIVINSCYEGLEGATVNIYSGDITIHATDDLVNAANSDLSSYNFTINVYGGKIVSETSTGDGFDSNGDINIYGGEMIIWTANTADNQPLDADGTITVTGGTVLAAGGSSGMGMNLSAEQPYVTYGSSGGSSVNISKGDTVTISGESGILSTEALTNARFVFFSSGELTDGEEYKLTVGDTKVSATAATGEISTGMGGFGGFGGFGKGDRPGGRGNDRQGNEPTELPEDFDPDDLPDDFDPDNMPEMPGDFNPDDLPDDFDPDKAPEKPDGSTKGDPPEKAEQSV